LSGDGSDSQSLVGATNPHSAANGVYTSCACAALGTSPADKTFAAGFKKLAHFAPAIYSGEAFDAANTIIDELKILSKHGTGAITRLNVVNGLHKITYIGLTKKIGFRKNGDIAGTAIYVNQVQHGVLVQLGLES